MCATETTPEPVFTDMNQQVVYCTHQLQRLSHLLATGKVGNRWERVVQYGYYSGRQTALFEKLGIQSDITNTGGNKYMAAKIIRTGLPKVMFDVDGIDFGCALGYLQETETGLPGDNWYQEILPFVQQEKWDQVVVIARQLIDTLLTDQTPQIDWSYQKMTTFDDAKRFNIPPASDDFLNKL